jgi:hypothetical protein
VLNRKIIDSCSKSNLDCKDPAYAGKIKDTVPPRLLTSVGKLRFHAVLHLGLRRFLCSAVALMLLVLSFKVN